MPHIAFAKSRDHDDRKARQLEPRAVATVSTVITTTLRVVKDPVATALGSA